MAMVADLALVRRLGAADQGLAVAATTRTDGSVHTSLVNAGVLDHPANAVAWLANKLVEHGGSIKAGQIILSGTFTRPLPVGRGDTVRADYGPWGVVTCSFA